MCSTFNGESLGFTPYNISININIYNFPWFHSMVSLSVVARPHTYKHFVFSTCILKLTFWTGNIRDSAHTPPVSPVSPVPVWASVPYREARFVPYSVYTRTEKFGTFCTMSVPVPRKVSTFGTMSYRYREVRYVR